jgi:hypothetical protein
MTVTAMSVIQLLDEIPSQRAFKFWETVEDLGLASPKSPYTLSIPLSNPSRSEDGQTVLLKLFDYKLAVRHLLWKLLFKGFSVTEWFILQHELEFQKLGWDSVSYACLAGVLSLSSKSRKTLDRWTSQTRPIHSGLKSLIPTGDSEFSACESLLDMIVLRLGIPQKGLPSSSLYISQIVFDKHRCPIPINSMGVGYRDKGSWSPRHICKLPSPKQYPDSKPYFELKSLIQQWTRLRTDFCQTSSPVGGVSVAPKPTDESFGKDETPKFTTNL